jgi:hypothetical protein
MAQNPAVKGSLVAQTIEQYRKLRDEDLAVLEEPPNISRWYELSFYQRLMELVYEHDPEGGGPRDEWQRKMCFEYGQKLLEADRYRIEVREATDFPDFLAAARLRPPHTIGHVALEACAEQLRHRCRSLPAAIPSCHPCRTGSATQGSPSARSERSGRFF